MLNLNRVEIIGNLTRDPELRYTANGQAVANFAVATNRRLRDAAGNWSDAAPEYHETVVWGQLGERCNQILHKGDRVYVSGRLQTRSWEAQDGTKRYKTELIADAIIGPDMVNKNMGGGSSDASLGEYQPEEPVPSSPSPSSKASRKKGAPAQPSEDEIDIEDIPF
jgi:single-strand DNA-binding protein